MKIQAEVLGSGPCRHLVWATQRTRITLPESVLELAEGTLVYMQCRTFTSVSSRDLFAVSEVAKQRQFILNHTCPEQAAIARSALATQRYAVRPTPTASLGRPVHRWQFEMAAPTTADWQFGKTRPKAFVVSVPKEARRAGHIGVCMIDLRPLHSC
jgi:hypothetical protein